jgi:hypothetical protein
MQTEPDPSPDPSSAGSAVGLAFVAIVLVSLFVAGSLGVVATRQTGSSRDRANQPEQPAVASASTAGAGRNRIVTRFRELVLLREIALRERDPGLLDSVYVPGATGLAIDRAEIARLRASGSHLDGLRLPVKVLNATRLSGTRWLVVARIGRSPARLVTGSGRQLRATRATTAVYHCTLVKQNGSWRMLRLVKS